MSLRKISFFCFYHVDRYTRTNQQLAVYMSHKERRAGYSMDTLNVSGIYDE